MTTFSPSDAAMEGIRLTRTRPWTILGWAVINFLGIAVIGSLMLLTLGGQFIDFVQNGGLMKPNPRLLASMIDTSWPGFVVILFVVMLFISILTGGIFRMSLRPEEPGFIHLRIGKDELRLTVLNTLLFAIGIVMLTLIDFVSTQVTGLSGVLVALLTIAIAIIPMAWVGVRLSLATPMTFAEHRIDLRRAWALTRGRFWPLFGMIVLAAIFYAMAWVLILILYGIIVLLAGGVPTIDALQAGKITPGLLIGLPIVIVLQLVLPVLQWVMLYSPLAVAYRAIVQVEAEAKAAAEG